MPPTDIRFYEDKRLERVFEAVRGQPVTGFEPGLDACLVFANGVHLYAGSDGQLHTTSRPIA